MATVFNLEVAVDCPQNTNNILSGSHGENANNDKIKINLNGVAKTLLIPLIARAHDNDLSEPVLGDPYARDILHKLEFDIDTMPLTPFQIAGISLRTSHFDQWTSSFLKQNPKTTVLHLACGLDSRMQRVEWGEQTRWFDIDLPEVIEIRKEVMPVPDPIKRDYSMIGVDVLDEYWMQNICEVSGPVLVIMEGLLSYLPEKDVQELLGRICEHFPQGEIIFECISSVSLDWLNRSNTMQAVNSTGAVFRSSIDDPISLETIHPRLKLEESVSIVQASDTEKFPIFGRIKMYIASWFASGRDSGRFLRFRFG